MPIGLTNTPSVFIKAMYDIQGLSLCHYILMRLMLEIKYPKQKNPLHKISSLKIDMTEVNQSGSPMVAYSWTKPQVEDETVYK